MSNSGLKNADKGNRYFYGLGTVGRDMVFGLVSMYLMYYLTDILRLSNATLWGCTIIIVASRIFDALNDPVMGIIVDNTRSPWGKFKPWIALGTFGAGILTILLFTDFNLAGNRFLFVFAIVYIAWGLLYTANDIAYWSMLPSLSLDPHQRERIGAFARICANIGLFAVVGGIVPLTNLLGEISGSASRGFFLFSLILVGIMWLGQSITLLGVKEPRNMIPRQPATPLRELFGTIVKNDQLLFIALALALFMTAYLTTGSFGLYFFKYAFGNEDMYPVFAIVLGLSQVSALLVFPWFSQRFTREKLFKGALISVVIGYLVFFFSPMVMGILAIGGVLIFFGQAFIQLLMILFLADTIEYGQLKLGRRNESITFSLQPLINKLGGAIGSGVVLATVIISGISQAESAAEVSASGIWMLKAAMMLIPMFLVMLSYLIFQKKYRIDAETHARIVRELKERGDLL